MKQFVSLLLAALLFLSLGACGQKATDDDAVRLVGQYKVVLNDNERKDTYPYVLRTENSAWYLAAADIESMGEEAFYKRPHLGGRAARGDPHGLLRQS